MNCLLQRIVFATFILMCGASQSDLLAQSEVTPPDDYPSPIATEDWTVLHRLNSRLRGTKPIPKSAGIISLTDLSLTGPEPSHPFVLGQYQVNGSFGLVNGYLQQVSGEDAAMQLCWADEFELEGIMEHVKVGGWLIIVGWQQEHGYVISNVTMKESGSPWFITELRAGEAVKDSHTEFQKFEWRGEQPFQLTIKDNQVKLKVDRFDVLDAPLENYHSGSIIIGSYDTKYGPKPFRIKSLRVRSAPSIPIDND